MSSVYSFAGVVTGFRPEGLTFKGKCYSALAQMLDTRSVTERLAHLLLHLADSYGVEEEGAVVAVGITDYAQEQMSELTFVELPEVGEQVEAEEEVAVVESVKAANDVYAPLSGTITEVNEALQEQPELVNSDPFGATRRS